MKSSLAKISLRSLEVTGARREQRLVALCLRFIVIMIAFELAATVAGSAVHPALQVFLAQLAGIWLEIGSSASLPVSVAGALLISSGNWALIDQRCDGLHMLFAFTALIFAQGKVHARTFVVAAVGVLVLILFNSLRIAHLFSLLRAGSADFELYHLYLWQFGSVLVLIGLALAGLRLSWYGKLRAKRPRMARAAYAAPAALMLMTIAATGVYAGGGGGGGGGAALPVIGLPGVAASAVSAALIVVISWLRRA
jgi:exosortase/archaeosortase family protein